MKRALLVGLLAVASLPALAVPPSFIEFESGSVRPVALSPDGSRLFVANTPDNRLEVFSVNLGGTLSPMVSIPVGMEPVAVAARTSTEVWVVNHLSDSVSIVDLAAAPPRVVRTLLVGDEPRDIVFAGTGGNRAFVTTAHRGQHRSDSSISAVTGAGDPELTRPSLGRADVWVFDATNLGAAFGGTPLRILTFFADTPRALAASADGSTVYVAAFHSGNQSTPILEINAPDAFVSACGGGGGGTGLPGPADNSAHVNAPFTGLIVKRSGANWVDSLGCTWNSQVQFTLPDRDVFAMNANTFAPGTIFSNVGTVLFNMAVNPSSGKIYVTNTESPNLTRFEGPGTYGGSTVQGHLSETRITVLTPGGGVDPQHLNQHINYSLLHTTAGANHALINAQAQHSLATPLQPIVSSDGSKIYVAAFGSSKIGVFDRTEIEDPSFESNYDPTLQSSDYISVAGGGPAGLALDETNNRLYVLTRFDNSVRVIDPTTKTTLATHPLYNPEPSSVTVGRKFLYDAQLTSANGEASCSSCHIFGDFDSLSWNLGNPDDVVTSNPQLSASPNLPKINNFPVQGANWTTFHPMKGPMSTQTLKGMATHGAMHWRGDRSSGFFGTDACNNSSPSNSPCDERLSFRNFIVAFVGLVGRQNQLTSAEMDQFTDFILGPSASAGSSQVFLPPNPVRSLDNTLAGSAEAGRQKYFGCNTFNGVTQCSPNQTGTSDTVEDCDGCHELKPQLGFFGTAGQQTFEGEPQNAKVAHLRNAYAKIGMFGVGQRLFALTMNGANEVPGPGDSDGAATGTIALSTETDNQVTTGRVSWWINYSGIAAPTGMHIHGPGGSAGSSANVLVDLGVTTTGGVGTLFGTTTTTVANINSILANPPDFYVNIHTSEFPNGAVRGQLGTTTEQVRGVGFLHDGGVDTVNTFLGAPVFALSPTEQRDLEQFILRFPTDLAPIVGQQVTLTSSNSGVAGARIDLLKARADASYASFTLGGTVRECDLIVKGSVGVNPAGWVMQADTPSGCAVTHSCQFRDDFHTLSDPAGLWTDAQVRALAVTDGPLTYTCAPPGSGTRMGIDRNLDGTPDGLPEPGAVLSLASGFALLAALARRPTRDQRTTIA
jgi:DNA-binding beta-propeller fold protein YncE